MRAAPLLLAALLLSGTGFGQRGSVSDLVNVSAEDAAVNAAIRQARAQLPQFLAALAHPAGRTAFGVKRAFPYGQGNNEYMWLSEVQVRAGRVTATLDNTPEFVKGAHPGQRFSFPLSEVADWAYTQNGQLHGNFTLRVFRARMTPQERADLGAQLAVPLSPKP